MVGVGALDDPKRNDKNKTKLLKSKKLYSQAFPESG